MTPPAPPSQAISGTCLRRGGSWVLRLSAVAVAVGAPLASALAWGLAWTLEAIPTTPRWVAALLGIQLLYLVWAALAARLLWRRARALTAARTLAGRHHALPILAAFIGLSGELLALAWSFVGIGCGGLVVLAGEDLMARLSASDSAWFAAPAWLRGMGVAVAGLGSAAAGMVAAWFSLLVSYALAEFLATATDVAEDTGAIRSRLDAE